jgi:hypothetical protein
MCPVGYDEELHIFKKSTRCPETLSLIAIDLIECFPDSDSSSLELYMYKGQSIDEDGNIIAIGSHPIIGGILIDDLESIIVYISFIEDIDIFVFTVISLQYFYMIFLYGRCFFDNMLILVGDGSREKMLPLRITKFIFIESLELFPEVHLEISLTSESDVLIGLLLEFSDELFFECIFALILLRSTRRWGIVRDDSALRILHDEMGIFHIQLRIKN